MAFSRLFTLLGSKPKTRTGNKFPKAKAKDLTFKVKAKAKGTIGWPRGASRPRPCPRGPQFWCIYHLVRACLNGYTALCQYTESRSCFDRKWFFARVAHFPAMLATSVLAMNSIRVVLPRRVELANVSLVAAAPAKRQHRRASRRETGCHRAISWVATASEMSPIRLLFDDAGDQLWAMATILCHKTSPFLYFE